MPPCPNCGSNDTISKGYADKKKTIRRCLCKDCGKYFSVPIEQAQEQQQKKQEAQQVPADAANNKAKTPPSEQQHIADSDLAKRVEQLEQVVAQLAQELQRLSDLLEELSETCC